MNGLSVLSIFQEKKLNLTWNDAVSIIATKIAKILLHRRYFYT